MMRLWAIASREYASFFRTPLGWLVIALFLFLSSCVVGWGGVLAAGQPATMRSFFSIWWLLLVIVAPAISMRLFSDEIRNGTIEPLLTAPLSEGLVVAGKYLASVLFLVTMFAPTLLYVFLLQVLAPIDLGPIFAGYLGLLLIGMLYLSVGTLTSSLTSNQPLAFLSALFILLLLELPVWLIAGRLPEATAKVLFAISPNLRIADFAKGVIDTANIAFFLTASFWFLAVASIVLQSRRWR